MSSKQTAKRKQYPIGSISSCTMRPEDLIPTYCDQLNWLAIHNEYGDVPAKQRKAHKAMFTEIMDKTDDPEYFDTEDCHYDLEELSNALEMYAGPYFYFGAHPGDGADYGFWLSESWDEEFYTVTKSTKIPRDQNAGIKVDDLSLVPSWFRGEVAVISDHGNVTLYVKTSRTLREIWSVV